MSHVCPAPAGGALGVKELPTKRPHLSEAPQLLPLPTVPHRGGKCVSQESPQVVLLWEILVLGSRY